MASRYYCANVAGELEVLSDKLHRLSDRFDRVPSIDKWRLQPHIDELHIIMTELDDRLCELVDACSTAEMIGENVGEIADKGFRETARRGELFDYDVGG